LAATALAPPKEMRVCGQRQNLTVLRGLAAAKSALGNQHILGDMTCSAVPRFTVHDQL